MGGGDGLVFRYAHGVNALTLEGTNVQADMGAVRSELERTLGATAVEACALELDDAIVGALVAVGSRPFDDDARRLLATFSSHVALALANARAVGAKLRQVEEEARREAAAVRERAAGESVRRAIEAQDAERARLARELHDEAGQALTALAVHLRALEGDVPGGPCGSGSPSCAARWAPPRRRCASWPRASAPPPSRRAGSRRDRGAGGARAGQHRDAGRR